MNAITEYFNFLHPKLFLDLDSTNLLKYATQLQEKYESDINESFGIQLILFQKVFKEEIKQLHTIKYLAELIIVKYSDMTSSFSEVVSVLILYLTLPVTVAKAERSFSKLKIIKNFLRTSMTQDRLSSLALLSIEAEEAAKMNV